ncbi:hypothetical protein KCP73_04705 [Salmonella enterica subsp. enterica]|nr:hypothetical protein KCP73_04705 [Salmonella enterica subsp. enterica]
MAGRIALKRMVIAHVSRRGHSTLLSQNCSRAGVRSVRDGTIMRLWTVRRWRMRRHCLFMAFA